MDQTLRRRKKLAPRGPRRMFWLNTSTVRRYNINLRNKGQNWSVSERLASAAPSSGHIGCTAKTSQTAQPERSSGRGEVTRAAAKHNRRHVMVFSALTRETGWNSSSCGLISHHGSRHLLHSIRGGRIHTKDPETKWWINSCPLWKWWTTSAQRK